jgi:tetratricopeptide (TPR) repeat protein
MIGKTFSRFCGIAAGAVLLGGCQSFPLTSWMFKKDTRPSAERPALAGNTVGALEEGGAYLRGGNISAAVASYRIALLDHATRADASNGLAVAYAKLGRDDLAERYFKAAMAAEPDNPKFVANLLRLQQHVMMARRVGEKARASEVLASAQPAPLPRPAEFAAGGLVERVSRGEVRLRTRSELGNAPTMTLAFANAPVIEGEGASDATAGSESSRANTVRFLFGQ